jgi:hypothetical protein
MRSLGQFLNFAELKGWLGEQVIDTSRKVCADVVLLCKVLLL